MDTRKPTGAEKASQTADAVETELGNIGSQRAEDKRLEADEKKKEEADKAAKSARKGTDGSTPEVKTEARRRDEEAHATQNPQQDRISEEDKGDAYESTPIPGAPKK